MQDHTQKRIKKLKKIFLNEVFVSDFFVLPAFDLIFVDQIKKSKPVCDKNWIM